MADESVSSWMPLWIGDYLADTMHLTTKQHGAYLLLLFAYWKSAKALPDDDNYLAQITKLPLEQWRKNRPVLEGFFHLVNGCWYQKRIELELSEAKRVKLLHAKGAASTNAKRWKNRSASRSAINEHVAQRVANDVASESPPPPPPPSSTAQGDVPLAEPPLIPPKEREIDGPVVPPPDFPRNEKEAADCAEMGGVPRDYAITLFNEVVGRGYRDFNQGRVHNWRCFAKGCWDRKVSKMEEKKLAAQSARGGNGKPDYWKSKSQYELLCSEIKAIEDRAPQDAMGTMILSEMDRTRYVELRKRRIAVKRELGL